MTYCWKCPVCERTHESSEREQQACICGHWMIRDWRTENVSFRVEEDLPADGPVV